MTDFTVEDNVAAGRHSKEEIRVMRHSNHTTMVWKLSYEELIDLQTTIATFIAGDRLG